MRGINWNPFKFSSWLTMQEISECNYFQAQFDYREINGYWIPTYSQIPIRRPPSSFTSERPSLYLKTQWTSTTTKKSIHENDCVKVNDPDFRRWFEALAHKGSLRLMNIQQDGSSDFIRESVMQQTASFYDIYPHIWHHDSLMDYG